MSNLPPLTRRKRLRQTFGFLKDLDIFQVPITDNINFERHDKRSNKFSYSSSIGSYFGGVLTVIWYIAVISYVSVMIAQMQSGAIDQIQTLEITNSGLEKDGGKNDLKLSDYDIMPMLEIFDTGIYNHPEFDIWEDFENKVIDWERFFNYVTVVAIQRNRLNNSPFTIYVQNMRACIEEDFTSRGLTPDKKILSLLTKKFYLCFDPKGPGNSSFGVKNFYSSETRNGF